MSDTDSSSNPEDLIESDAGPDELDESDYEQPDDELPEVLANKYKSFALFAPRRLRSRGTEG